MKRKKDRILAPKKGRYFNPKRLKPLVQWQAKRFGQIYELYEEGKLVARSIKPIAEGERKI